MAQLTTTPEREARPMKILLVLAIIAIGLFLGMCVTAVVIATSGAWFLHLGWVDSWHEAWASWLRLFGAMLLLGAVTGGSAASSRR